VIGPHPSPTNTPLSKATVFPDRAVADTDVATSKTPPKDRLRGHRLHRERKHDGAETQDAVPADGSCPGARGSASVAGSRTPPAPAVDGSDIPLDLHTMRTRRGG